MSESVLQRALKEAQRVRQRGWGKVVLSKQEFFELKALFATSTDELYLLGMKCTWAEDQ